MKLARSLTAALPSHREAETREQQMRDSGEHENCQIDPAFKYELRKLSDIAFAFLNAANGDKVEAETMLDDFIDLVFEGGALSTWRYRILLANIRQGL